MTYDQQEAQAKIAAILELPRIMAGASSIVLAIVVDGLEVNQPTRQEFGGLQSEAFAAFSTVCSALLAMRDTAVEREKAQP